MEINRGLVVNEHVATLQFYKIGVDLIFLNVIYQHGT